ncbi:homoserine kinase [Priestia taiwanensis]|uniref:Homoserine kinase n=1 Tax=Priestia taiwanensis TaxID=1347902 RepID=A0A917AX69_9BACI|nr:homoserine kinase [Priestia taiwanensis]MBM7363415.1 homoserine kinase [Priestia taiwanensis]GGE77366.1 homoserine kinase [Priestia taiwanensis]
MMFTVRVPATTANLGPGFDSMGLALSLYLDVEVIGPSEVWNVIHDLGDDIPQDERNLIVETALYVHPSLPPHTLKVRNDIPLTRGLGSSASAIVAGIEVANMLGNLLLSKEEKVKIASIIEQHPDNVAPAILGDFVVGMVVEAKVRYIHHTFPPCDIIAVIPYTELKTTESRNVLPEAMPYKDAVKASATANVLVASLLLGDWDTAKGVMEEDVFHEPYRSKLVPHLEKVRQVAKENGAYGTVLSGAGPCVLVFTGAGEGESLQQVLQKIAEDMLVQQLEVEKEGARIIHCINQRESEEVQQ